MGLGRVGVAVVEIPVVKELIEESQEEAAAETEQSVGLRRIELEVQLMAQLAPFPFLQAES